jgi:hypothetical protein
MKKRRRHFLFTILAAVILLSLQMVMDVQVSASDSERENSYGHTKMSLLFRIMQKKLYR